MHATDREHRHVAVRQRRRAADHLAGCRARGAEQRLRQRRVDALGGAAQRTAAGRRDARGLRELGDRRSSGNLRGVGERGRFGRLARALATQRCLDLATHLVQRTLRRGLVVGDAQHDDVAVRDADGRAVLALGQHLVAEHRLYHARIVAERTAALAGVARDGLQLQAVLLRHALELAERRERVVRQLLRLLVEQRLRLLRAVIGLELGAHFLERALVRGLDFLELDHVPAELGLNRRRDLAGLHREHRLGELRHVGLAGRPAELAALILRAGVGGVLLRQRGEIAARLRLCGDLVGSFLRGRVVAAGLDQDVARAAPLGVHVAFRRDLVVVLAEARLVDLEAGRDVGRLQLDVLQRGGLGRDVAGLVGLVVRLHLLRRERDRGLERGGREHEPVGVTGLAGECDALREFARRHERRDRDAAAQLSDREILAEFVLESSLAAPLLRQQCRVTVAVEAAVDLQCRDRLDLLDQHRITDAIAHLVRMLVDDRATDEFVDQLLLLRGDQRRRQLVAGGLLQLGLSDLPGATHLADRDALAVHLGGGRRRTGLEADAPEDEHHGDRAEEHDGEPAGNLVANLLQHRTGSLYEKARCRGLLVE